MEAFFQEISEHISNTRVDAMMTNNSINFVEIEVFGGLSAKFFSLLGSQEFSEMITMSSKTIARLQEELGSYYSWDVPTKKGLGFCLAWYHIFQAMAWGGLEKGDMSVSQLEQALIVTDLPIHTKKLAVDMKHEMIAIVEAENKKKKGFFGKLFG